MKKAYKDFWDKTDNYLTEYKWKLYKIKVEMTHDDILDVDNYSVSDYIQADPTNITLCK